MTPLRFTDFEFDQTVTKSREFYATIGTIRCPYFRDPIIFSAQGLEHLRRKALEPRPRSIRSVYASQISLGSARDIAPVGHGSGVWHAHERIRQHRHGKWEEVFKPATYYEFVAIVKDRRFKVIVKESEGQGKQF